MVASAKCDDESPGRSALEIQDWRNVRMEATRIVQGSLKEKGSLGATLSRNYPVASFIGLLPSCSSEGEERSVLSRHMRLHM